MFCWLQGENILQVELDMPNRTTRDYEGPSVAPKIQAVLDAALEDEGDIDIDDRSAHHFWKWVDDCHRHFLKVQVAVFEHHFKVLAAWNNRAWKISRPNVAEKLICAALPQTP